AISGLRLLQTQGLRNPRAPGRAEAAWALRHPPPQLQTGATGDAVAAGRLTPPFTGARAPLCSAPMTTTNGAQPVKDISAAAVWIACAGLWAVLIIIALIDPTVLEGPPTRLGRNHELGLLETLQNVFLL